MRHVAGETHLDELRVLVIEDDPRLAEYFEQDLSHGDPVTGRPCAVLSASSLADGMSLADEHPLDVVILDLMLPDSQDLATVLRVLDSLPRVPVIVVTGTKDEAFADEVLRAGAHDFLLKSQLDSTSLWRTIRHTVTRHRTYLAHLEVIDERRRLDAELAQMLEGRTGVTAGALGLGPLRDRAFSTFDQLAARYRDLLDVTLEGRAIENVRKAPGLNVLADELGFLRAGPNDAVDLHVAATQAALDGVGRARASAVLDAARLQLVALLGHLMNHYRTQALAGSDAFTSTTRTPGNGSP